MATQPGTSSNTDPTQQSANAAASTRQLTPVDQEIIMEMISMGFSPELAQEAVIRSPPDSLEQAVEYCFNHPTNTSNTPTPTVTTVTDATATTTTEQQPTTSTASSTVFSNEPARPVIEGTGVGGSVQAAASISGQENSSNPSNDSKLTKESSLNKEKAEEIEVQTSEDALFQLDKTILDKFANTMLPGLMKILGMHFVFEI